MALLPKITSAEEQTIINEYLQNPKITIKDLSKKYRRKPDTLKLVFKRNNIKIERNRTSRISKEIINKVSELYRAGKTIVVLAKEFNISCGSVSNIIRTTKINKVREEKIIKQIEQKIEQTVIIKPSKPQGVAKILYENLIPYENRGDQIYLPEQDLIIDGNQFNADTDILQKLNLRFIPLNLTVRLIDFKTANALLERAHYLGGASKATSYYFGFYCDHSARSDELIGVATFGRVANPHEKLLCLSRFCVLERARIKNLSSQLMSLALKFLKKQGYRGKVVSWSDTRIHSGALYKATNWKQIINKKYKRDYIYIDGVGREYHKSKVRVPAGISEHETAQKMGLTRVNIPPKQRWEYEIK